MAPGGNHFARLVLVLFQSVSIFLLPWKSWLPPLLSFTSECFDVVLSGSRLCFWAWSKFLSIFLQPSWDISHNPSQMISTTLSGSCGFCFLSPRLNTLPQLWFLLPQSPNSQVAPHWLNYWISTSMKLETKVVTLGNHGSWWPPLLVSSSGQAVPAQSLPTPQLPGNHS